MESFKKLSKTEKEKYFDKKMSLLQRDMIDAKEAGYLFIELDSERQFENILLMFISYPNEMCQFYDLTSHNLDYNIKHWNGISGNTGYCSKNNITLDDLMFDIINIFFGNGKYVGSGVSKLLKGIFFDGKEENVKSKYLELHNKLHG